MGKTFALAVLLLLSASTAIFAGSPVTGEVTLRLKDAQQRPVQNATAKFEYISTDPVMGELHKSDLVVSDTNGMVRHRLGADFGTQCNITIERNFASEKISINWVGTTERFVDVPLSDFTVRIVDTDGNQLSNVPLRIETARGSLNSATNATGFRIFTQYYRDMDYDIFATYGGREYSIRMRPDNRLHTIQIPTYSIEIRTLDDRGRSLETEMTLTYTAVGNITKRTYGIAGLFTQLPEGNATLSVVRGSQQITTSFYINSSVRKSLIFDETAPAISVPWTIPIRPVPENEVQVFVNVTDEGEFAKGMPQTIEGSTPVSMNYSINGVDWTYAKMVPDHSQGSGVYMARLPSFPPDSVIRYMITATDNAGNTATSPQHMFNTLVHHDGETSGGEDPLQALSVFWWIPALIVVLAIAYVIKSRYF